MLPNLYRQCNGVPVERLSEDDHEDIAVQISESKAQVSVLLKRWETVFVPSQPDLEALVQGLGQGTASRAGGIDSGLEFRCPQSPQAPMY